MLLNTAPSPPRWVWECVQQGDCHVALDRRHRHRSLAQRGRPVLARLLRHVGLDHRSIRVSPAGCPLRRAFRCACAAHSSAPCSATVRGHHEDAQPCCWRLESCDPGRNARNVQTLGPAGRHGPSSTYPMSSSAMAQREGTRLRPAAGPVGDGPCASARYWSDHVRPFFRSNRRLAKAS